MDFKWRFAVRLGKSHHPWAKAKIIRVFDEYNQAEDWIKVNIKEGQHMYIDFVKEVNKNGPQSDFD